MGLSRRRLLQGAVAIACSGAPSLRWIASATAAPVAGSAATPSWLSRASYANLVGTPFVVTVGRSRFASLTLSAIDDLTPQGGGRRAASSDGRFSLLFMSASTVPQGTWPIHHDALGDTALFIVPVGRVTSPGTYEVIVNRLS